MHTVFEWLSRETAERWLMQARKGIGTGRGEVFDCQLETMIYLCEISLYTQATTRDRAMNLPEDDGVIGKEALWRLAGNNLADVQ